LAGKLIQDLRAEISAAITREIPDIVKTITETLSEKARVPLQDEDEEDEETVAAFRCLKLWVRWGITLEYVLISVHLREC
jgi:hypothetical protein